MSTKQNYGEPVQKESANIKLERVKRFKELFPEISSEGDKIDFDKLRTALEDVVDDDPERYAFTWAGKKESIRLLQVPSRGTLVPVSKGSVNFDDSNNLFIEGENLEVLKLLYKSYAGRIKMIYLDPPYNTGNDFVYPDNFVDPLDTYLKLTAQQDDAGNLLTSNPESSGRYHSAWLSMMYPRLLLARQLLRDDGMIFVSIDDIEIHNLKMVMNEIFGEENFVDCIIWKKRYGGGAKEKHLVTLHEYIIFYAKNKNMIGNIHVPLDKESIKKYYKGKDEKFDIQGPYRTHPLEATKSVEVRKNLIFGIPSPGGDEILPERQWWWGKERVMEALANNELEFIKGKNGKIAVHTKQYLRDENGEMRQTKPFSMVDDVYTQHGTAEIAELFGDSRMFPFPKPSKLIYFLLQIANLSDSDIVLDFFAGSCSTAQALIQINKDEGINSQFIMVQLPEPTPEDSFPREKGYENIAEIGKDRIRKFIDKISREGGGKNPDDLGFKVFKLKESNYKPWPGVESNESDEYIDQMKLFSDPLKDGWNIKDVIWEIAIKEGYSLNCRIEKIKKIKKNKVYLVANSDKKQSFYISLDKKISLDGIELLGLTPDNIFICRDVALNDETAANLALQCRLKTI